MDYDSNLRFRRGNNMAKGLARPIKTRRDYKHAASIAGKAREQAEQEPAAERRLQALLSEIDKFDGDTGDEVEADAVEDAEDIDSEFRRRWSDDA
jgi:hypothetical protein